MKKFFQILFLLFSSSTFASIIVNSLANQVSIGTNLDESGFYLMFTNILPGEERSLSNIYIDETNNSIRVFYEGVTYFLKVTNKKKISKILFNSELIHKAIINFEK